jgi:sugar (pentulose or hexulose) kinase
VHQNSIHWDVLRLFFEIKKGLSLFVKKYGDNLDGIGIDTWGLDFGLFDKDGHLLGNPYHYRDKRTEGIVEEVADIIDPYRIYEITGMRLEPIITLCQLYSMVKSDSSLLETAEFLLMMPGIFNYFLTGEKLEEYTILSPSCLYDIREDAFATEFLRKLSIPEKLMPRVIKPGTITGNLLPEVSKEVGLGKVPVVAPACHDTASAVVAVPAVDKTNWAFISSGTWSVVGIETPEPLIDKESFHSNIVNEGTAGRKFIAVSNISGLWIIQECRKAWQRQGETLDWPHMIRLAGFAKPSTAFIDTDDKAFVNPPDMPGAIIEYCRKTNQKVSEDKGTIIRIALESLALKYKKTLEKIEKLKGESVEVLHIVGGGTQNKFLNQLTADATGKTVLAGPIEATAIGNIVMQAIGTGYLKSIDEARRIIRSSFEIETYCPENKGGLG